MTGRPIGSGVVPVWERMAEKKEVVGECWHYLGAQDRGGGGLVHHEGRMQRAHRVAYAESNGRELSGLGPVLRTCGNAACWNPAHLEEHEDRERLPVHAPSTLPAGPAVVSRLREQTSGILMGKGLSAGAFVPEAPQVCEDCGEELGEDMHVCRVEEGS